MGRGRVFGIDLRKWSLRGVEVAVWRSAWRSAPRPCAPPLASQPAMPQRYGRTATLGHAASASRVDRSARRPPHHDRRLLRHVGTEVGRRAVDTTTEQPSDVVATAAITLKQRVVLVGRDDAAIADASSTSCACCCALSHGST